MQEIREAFYDLLEADTQVRSMTGWVAGDKRIYEINPPKKITINSTYPAYMTFRWTSPGMMMQSEYVQKAQYPDEFVELDVYANTSVLRDQLAERIDFILKDKEWDTASWRVMTTDRLASNDIQEIHPGTSQLILKRKYMRFQFRDIYRK